MKFRVRVRFEFRSRFRAGCLGQVKFRFRVRFEFRFSAGLGQV